jgi:hypothetical protein
MAAPTTLQELATQRSDAAHASAASARTALADAQQALADARKTQSDLTGEVAAIEREIARIRRGLAAASTPADGDALLDELETTLISLHAKQTALLDAGTAMEAAIAREARANADLTAATALVTASAAQLKAAEAAGKVRSDLTTPAKLAELAQVRAEADAALNTAPANQPFTAAKTRVEGEIPTELIARARERRTAAVAAIEARATALRGAENLIATQADTEGGLPGKAEKRRVEFERAEAAFLTYALHGREMLEQAKSMLARVADASKSPMTQAQRDRINDATLVADGTAAAAKEKDRDTALADVSAKQADLDKAILEALADDIDRDPATVAAVQTAQGALATAQGTLATAEGAYTADMRGDLDRWEAAVPDTAWQRLADFEEARAILTFLKDTDPAALATAMQTAEAAFAGALADVATNVRTERRLAAEAGALGARLTTERNAARQLQFAAIRGDR